MACKEGLLSYPSCSLVHSVIHLAWVVGKVNCAIQWISVNKTNHDILGIVNYPVESIIYLEQPGPVLPKSPDTLTIPITKRCFFITSYLSNLHKVRVSLYIFTMKCLILKEELSNLSNVQLGLFNLLHRLSFPWDFTAGITTGPTFFFYFQKKNTAQN